MRAVVSEYGMLPALSGAVDIVPLTAAVPLLPEDGVALINAVTVDEALLAGADLAVRLEVGAAEVCRAMKATPSRTGSVLVISGGAPCGTSERKKGVCTAARPSHLLHPRCTRSPRRHQS